MSLQQWLPAQDSPEVIVNENFEALAHLAVYSKDPENSSGLTWGYLGGRWAGLAVASGTLALTASATSYVVVARATGVISASTTATNWSNTESYARVCKITTGAETVTAEESWRVGGYGVLGQGDASGGGNALAAIPVACSDESTALTAGASKVTFRMPFAMALSDVRASLTVAQVSGSILTVDINAGGASILSTKLTIDNTEKSSTTASAAAVISSAVLADDAEITIDIDQIGDGSAKGLKVYLIGAPA